MCKGLALDIRLKGLDEGFGLGFRLELMVRLGPGEIYRLDIHDLSMCPLKRCKGRKVRVGPEMFTFIFYLM